MAREGLIGRTFVELADTLVEGYDVIEFLQRLTERCVMLLGVAEASVALADTGGALRAVASSSERMRLLALIELQRRDGPCLDCWLVGDPVVEDDLEGAAGRWPVFGPAALEAGFRSVYALPLRLRRERIGALNLFADVPNGLAGDDHDLGQAMADVATIGLLHERFLREQTTVAVQLQTALDSRVVLEQAKGMVAQQAGVDVDQAFQLIRGYARRRSERLTDVARSITTRELTSSALAPARTPRPSRG